MAETVLITGGAGFIGSHLAERLLRRDSKVIIIDDCSTGSLANLESIREHPNLTFIESTVSDCCDLPLLCSRADFIYHLAAAVGVELVVHSPIRTIETNLTETEVVLLAASTSQTPVMLASTSEVYGKSAKPAFDEEDDLLIGPPRLGRWSYACSKLMDEFLAMAYWREKNLPITIARLFNTVGPRQTGRYGMVLPRFVTAALNQQPLRVFGTGSQTRCFCDVEDAVEGLLRLKEKPAARGETFNLGSADEISIMDLARRVITLLDSISKIELIPYHEAYPPGFEDMMRRKPVIAKLKRVTDFEPRIKLDQTIFRIAEYIKAQGVS
jgi:UDP-glucose 4-epimerase